MESQTNKVSYLTDGVHLYEADMQRNYGLSGGTISIVTDCVTGVVHMMSELEMALCRSVDWR